MKENKLKIIDRYIIKQFIQTILFALIAFTLIFVIVDLMENLDDFIDQNVPTRILFNYYIVFAPEILKLMTPVAVLFSSLYTTGKMANLNEITALKSSGVSLYRLLLPMLFVTLFISLFSIYFGGYVVPEANKYKSEISVTYLKKGFYFTGNNIFFQDSKNRIINISYFDEKNNLAMRVGIQEFDPNDLTKMIRRIDANRMIFDTVKNVWIAYNGIDRKFNSINETIEYFTTKEIKYLNFSPNDLAFKQMKPQEMNLSELNRLIDETIKSGNNPTSIMIEYYSRYSFPMASLVVVLFGFPISANKRKGGAALQLGINVFATFIYLGLMEIFEAFGKNGALDPLLTAWIVNLIFLAAAIINFTRINQ